MMKSHSFCLVYSR